MIFKDFDFLNVKKFLNVVFIIVWLSNLSGTDAYFSVYAMIAFVAFYCIPYMHQAGNGISKHHNVALSSFSILLSALVIFANYQLFTLVRDPQLVQGSTNLLLNLINTCLSFFGGFIVFRLITFSAYHYLFRGCCGSGRSVDKKYMCFVIGTFLIIFGVSFVHLFAVEYPGNLTEDSFTQISEMLSGSYSDFNSFWHTKMFQALLVGGYSLFGEINAAVASVATVQALILSAAFTYSLSCLYLTGVPFGYLLFAFLVYSVLPYNIALGITIWKDVPFAAGCLFLCASLYRMYKNLGNSFWNGFFLIAGGLLFGLSRSNGWVVLLATFLIIAIPLRSNKKMVCMLACVVLVCVVLANPVLRLLKVAEGDISESLSVPLQQVSRVIVDGHSLTEEESDLISRVLDIEDVPELYTDWLSDPIKVEFRSNDVSYFQEHKMEYAKLWIRLGVKYPWSYFKAWVDQTKGYWNGGYNYAMYSETVTDNPYGVMKASSANIIAKLFGIYFGLSRHVIFFQPFHSIGLHVWITSLVLLVNILRKRKEWVLTVPGLLIVLGMCFGTPVYCSFRYVYPLFVTFPLILGSSLWTNEPCIPRISNGDKKSDF